MKMIKPFFSICIPTYNRKESLKIVLDSFIEEVEKLYPLVEICVSDNYSEDGTFDMLKDYAKKYKFIKIRRNKKNLGFDRNVIEVLKMAKGKYLWTLNDHYYIEKIENLEDLIENLKENKPKACLLPNVYPQLIRSFLRDLFFKKNIYTKKEFIEVYTNFAKFCFYEDNVFGLMNVYIFNKSLIEKVLNEKDVNRKSFYGWIHISIFLCLISSLKRDEKIVVYKKPLLRPIKGKKLKVFLPSELIKVFIENRRKAIEESNADEEIVGLMKDFVEKLFGYWYTYSLARAIVIKDFLDNELKDKKEIEKLKSLRHFKTNIFYSIIIKILWFIISNNFLKKIFSFLLTAFISKFKEYRNDVQLYIKKEISTSIERDLPGK